MIALFFAVWTIYSFMSGIVAVPYNDIVARSVPSERRSRLLALRFFGGGVLALIVAAAAHRLLAALPFHEAYAAVVLLGAVLLLGSAVLFVSAGEPQASAAPTEEKGGFVAFLYGGLVVLGGDRRFRLFVIAQLLGGVAAMALPFYILQAARTAGGAVPNAALLLGAQMAGALLSNPLWGWWGDRVGKASLLGLSSGLGVLPPALTLAWIGVAEGQGFAEAASLPWFAAVFALLGAAGSGGTIAQLGYLMEISPDDRRPAYSGYFNALIAPATLLPIAGGALAEATTLATVFAAGGVAAGLQVLLVRRLTALETGGQR